MIEVQEYIDRLGRNAFKGWFRNLNSDAQSRVVEYLSRLRDGNVGALKGLGFGLSELRLHAGPGYRVYCGRDGDVLVILLGGNTKQRQQKDIDAARTLWREYKERKRTVPIR